MKESDANWFRPLWRRVLVTVIVVVWFGFETLYSHEQLWIVISGVGLVYCVWNFFLRFPKAPAPDAPGASHATDDARPPSDRAP